MIRTRNDNPTRGAAFAGWQGAWSHPGPFAGETVAHCELPADARIEFLPPFQTGVTHLGVSVMGSDCTEFEDVTVMLHRIEVERLRDALTAWLDRVA